MKPSDRAVRLSLLLRRFEDRRVIASRDADKNAGRSSRQAGRIVSGVLDRMPRTLEEQPLLRIHQLRLAGGDAEKLRIESIDAIDEPCPFRRGVLATGRRRRGVPQVRAV